MGSIGRTLAAVALVAAAGSAGPGRAAPPRDPAGPVAFDRPETQAGANAPELQVSSPAFRDGQPMPQTYARDGKNVSPPLAWSGAPAATRSYVLIVQDPDADPSRPVTHWLAYDIPPTVHALNRGVRNIDEPTTPLGMRQGWNYHGSVGYTGPNPPIGEPAHHYHFQIFALDRDPDVAPDARLDRVLRAMKGHVIARGQLVGLYAIPAPKAPPASP